MGIYFGGLFLGAKIDGGVEKMENMDSKMCSTISDAFENANKVTFAADPASVILVGATVVFPASLIMDINNDRHLNMVCCILFFFIFPFVIFLFYILGRNCTPSWKVWKLRFGNLPGMILRFQSSFFIKLIFF